MYWFISTDEHMGGGGGGATYSVCYLKWCQDDDNVDQFIF